MRIQVITILALLVWGGAVCAEPTMYGSDGEPEQGQEITVDTTGLAPEGTLRIYLCDSPAYDYSKRTVQQTITFHGGGSGPVRFRADFNGFSDGDTVYVIPSNGDPVTNAASFGKPMVVGHPMVHAITWLGGFSHTARAIGVGYTANTGQAGAFIGDDPVWENCRTTVAQNVLAWSGTTIDFNVTYGSLDRSAPGYLYIVDDDGDYSVRGKEIALAHPVINSVTLEGTTLTTVGLGFKDRGGETIIFDNFEQGSNGMPLADTPSTSWQNWHYGGVYSTAHPHSGGLAATSPDTVGEMFDTSYYEFPPEDKIFVSYQLAYVYNGDLSQIGSVWKPTRINTNAAGASAYHGEGAYSIGQATTVGDGWPRAFWTLITAWDRLTGWRRLGDVPPPDGTYYRMELYRDLASAGTMDGLHFWRSGSSTSTDYAAPGRSPGTNFGMTTTILGTMASNLTGPVRIYIDDFYCASTQARVVIADAPVYENATQVVVQPVTSWSDDNIVADLNLAGLESSPERFVIVIDQNGDSSFGISLTGGQLGPPGQPGRPVRIP